MLLAGFRIFLGNFEKNNLRAFRGHGIYSTKAADGAYITQSRSADGKREFHPTP